MRERPWIEHTGDCVPFTVGQVVVIKYRSGAVAVRTNTANMVSGRLYDRGDMVGLNPLLWAINGRNPKNADTDVIAYRLHDNGQAEAERRAERMEQFRKIADSGKWDIAPVKSPQKESV